MCAQGDDPTQIDEERRMTLYDFGYEAGRWARLNIPADLDARGGQPHTYDVTTHDPEWSQGYVEGAKPQPEVPDGTERCYFCHRPIVGGLFTLIDFGHSVGIQPVCDVCREKADEDQDDLQLD